MDKKMKLYNYLKSPVFTLYIIQMFIEFFGLQVAIDDSWSKIFINPSINSSSK